MKYDTQTIVDDNGIELLADYGYDLERGYEAEPGNPNTFVPGSLQLELKAVWLVIGGRSVNVMPLLHPAEIGIIKLKIVI